MSPLEAILDCPFPLHLAVPSAESLSSRGASDGQGDLRVAQIPRTGSGEYRREKGARGRLAGDRFDVSLFSGVSHVGGRKKEEGYSTRRVESRDKFGSSTPS